MDWTVHIKIILTRLWGFLVIFLYLVCFFLRSSLLWELRDNGVVKKFAILSLNLGYLYFLISEKFRVPGNSIVLCPELYITVLAYTSILNPEVPQVCVKSLCIFSLVFGISCKKRIFKPAFQTHKHEEKAKDHYIVGHFKVMLHGTIRNDNNFHFKRFQHCSNVWTLCCARNRHWKLTCVNFFKNNWSN